jgi:hypothetical protein
MRPGKTRGDAGDERVERQEPRAAAAEGQARTQRTEGGISETSVVISSGVAPAAQSAPIRLPELTPGQARGLASGPARKARATPMWRANARKPLERTTVDMKLSVTV